MTVGRVRHEEDVLRLRRQTMFDCVRKQRVKPGPFQGGDNPQCPCWENRQGRGRKLERHPPDSQWARNFRGGLRGLGQTGGRLRLLPNPQNTGQPTEALVPRA